MRSVLGWIVAHFFRWLPHSAPTGLFPIGEPDENSPVIVTANFSLTIKRVRKALKGRSAWLLVANSDGINVWCAADGGIFNENRVIDAIKVSALADRVKHREVILPALSAPGVDLEAIKKETGFRARFGPVYATMNFPVYLLVAVVLAIFWRQYLIGYTIIFWSAVAFLYVFLDVIPGKTGWGQAFLSAALTVLVWAGIDWTVHGDPFAHWGWFIATFAIFFGAGFDLAGTVSARESDAERMMHRLGFKSFGSMFSEKEMGKISLDRDRCKGCQHCIELCPVGVFAELDADRKTSFHDPETCFACRACVKQCPEQALSLTSR
jgi:NAD-dependent dihydropyrimidine dehydrogenase PreA subunit